jgi:hypothetical protein
MDALNDQAVFEIRVDCSAGYRGEESPRRFHWEDRSVDVAEVVDRWIGQDHRYFKVRDPDGDTWILRHDELLDRWELALYEASGSAEPSPTSPPA